MKSWRSATEPRKYKTTSSAGFSRRSVWMTRRNFRPIPVVRPFHYTSSCQLAGVHRKHWEFIYICQALCRSTGSIIARCQ